MILLICTNRSTVWIMYTNTIILYLTPNVSPNRNYQSKSSRSIKRWRRMKAGEGGGAVGFELTLTNAIRPDRGGFGVKSWKRENILKVPRPEKL